MFLHLVDVYFFVLFMYCIPVYYQMNQRTTKSTKQHVHPAKTKISLGIRPIGMQGSKIFSEFYKKKKKKKKKLNHSVIFFF